MIDPSQIKVGQSKGETLQGYSSNGHWKFEEQMGGKEYVGFIYIIFDKYMNKAYLGKKSFRGSGKLNRGKESDWRKYLSSSKLLGEHFKERPRSEFEFICLEQYKTKGCLSYAETWSLCFVEAPTSGIWLNKRVESVSWKVTEQISERHKNKLNELIGRLNSGI